MIQRKQTIFLLLAVVTLGVCLCLPVGEFEPAGMGVSALWYNMGVQTSRGFLAHPVLFIDLFVTAVISLCAIFLYKKRKAQMRLCSVGMVLCLAWYAYYAFAAMGNLMEGTTFHLRFASCLPFVAFVLLLKARRGVEADEKLVKSMDRIR